MVCREARDKYVHLNVPTRVMPQRNPHRSYCNDPSEPAQIGPLRRKPQQGFAWPEPGTDTGSCNSGSNRRWLGSRATGARTNGDVRTFS